MPESTNAPEPEKTPAGLPADWAMSRITPVAPRSPVAAPSSPVEPRPEPAPAPVFTLAAMHETPAEAAPLPAAPPEPELEPEPFASPLALSMLPAAEPPRPSPIVDPRVVGAIGNWQNRPVEQQPELRPEPLPSRAAASLLPLQSRASTNADAEEPAQDAFDDDLYDDVARQPEMAPAAPPAYARPRLVKARFPIRLPHVAPGLWRNLRVWQGAALFLALLCCLLAYRLLNAPPRFEIGLAPMGIVNSPAPIFLVETGETRLRVTALADIEVPKENDLQLWMVPPNTERPISLGVLPATGGIFRPSQPAVEGTRFVISLEPHGGATAGKITGKVLYGGQLADR